MAPFVVFILLKYDLVDFYVVKVYLVTLLTMPSPTNNNKAVWNEVAEIV
jgi:hypothetical protein